MLVPIVITAALGISYSFNKIQQSDVLKEMVSNNYNQLMEKKYNSFAQYMNNNKQRTVIPKKGEGYGDLVLQDAKKFPILKEMLKRNSIESLSDVYRKYNGGKDLDFTQEANLPSWKE